MKPGEHHKNFPYSVPLVYEGRVFFFEPGAPPRVSTVYKDDGRYIFEIRRNAPADNPLTKVAAEENVLTVAEKGTGRFLYRVRPGAGQTLVVLEKTDGEFLSVSVTDAAIGIGEMTVAHIHSRDLAAVVINPEGDVALGGAVETKLLEWFRRRQIRNDF